MSKRINVVLPDETVELPDRVAVKGARSRFIDYAVRHVVERHGRRGSNATNGCSQIVIQGAQDTELPPGNPSYPWQPPLAVAITGTGFGFLPIFTQPYAGQGTQPYVGQASALMNTAGTQSVLTISDNGGSTNGTSAWTTEPGQADTQSSCQVYIAEWNDSNIWLFLNLPVDVQDGYLEVADSCTDDLSITAQRRYLVAVSGDGARPVACRLPGGLYGPVWSRPAHIQDLQPRDRHECIHTG